MILYYLTHPQVAIDPQVAVPDWSLSDLGRNRVAAASGKPWVGSVRRIFSSNERKAVETAQTIAAAVGQGVSIRQNMGENDRSATGFIRPEEFEAAADAFFAEPENSWNGWETANDAQARIVAAVELALDEAETDYPVLFVGHGAVGTLLKCSLLGRGISRSEDQPNGGGNIFAFNLNTRHLLNDWTAVESYDGAERNG